jgi:hypothetical protein
LVEWLCVTVLAELACDAATGADVPRRVFFAAVSVADLLSSVEVCRGLSWPRPAAKRFASFSAA